MLLCVFQNECVPFAIRNLKNKIIFKLKDVLYPKMIWNGMFQYKDNVSHISNFKFSSNLIF